MAALTDDEQAAAVADEDDADAVERSARVLPNWSAVCVRYS
jgi:hypothetical protein